MFIKRKTSESGQVLVLLALGIVGLIGLVGLAIDAGNAFADRRNAQNAADNAAFAAALKKVSACAPNPSCVKSDWDGAGHDIAQKNGYVNNVNGDTVEVLWPPSADFPPGNPHAGDANYIQVTIHSTFDTYFAQVLGINTMQNRVSAIVRVKDSKIDGLYDGAAIVALAPHGDGMLDINGNVDLYISGGGLLTNSDYDGRCPQGALEAGGSSIIDVPSIIVVGNACGTDPNITEKTEKQFEYPVVEYILPEPGCATSGQFIKGPPQQLTPGYYSEFPPRQVNDNQPVEFVSGVYCIEGGFTLNGNEEWYSDQAEGEGVLFYFMPCSGNKCDVIFNGGSTVDVQALTNPYKTPYPGLLFYFATDPNCNPVALEDGCRTVTINGNNETSFEGTILGPDTNIKITGTSDSYGLSSQVIGYNIDLIGSGIVDIYFDEDDLLKLPTSPSIELVK